MSQDKSKPIAYLGSKLFAATIVATALVFFWTSSNYKNDQQTQGTWVDDNGHLHVLGLTLGETALRNAEIALKSRSDIALYIYPQGHADEGMTLEAFFPSIADHSKVILELKTSKAMLNQFQQRSTLPHLYPNMVVRMNVHAEDLPAIQRLIVKNLTLIPSIELTAENLTARFGEPSSSTTSEDGTTVYHFPAIGLKASLKEDDASRLFFTNPEKQP